MVAVRFRKEQTLAIFVDLSEGPLSSVHSMDGEQLRRNVGRWRKALALLGVPCLYAAAPLPEPAGRWIKEADWTEAQSVRHTTNDCFGTPEFASRVEGAGRRQLLVCGIATDVGVGLTALSAVAMGYDVGVIVDATGTVDARAEQAAILRLSQCGVVFAVHTAMAGELQQDYTKPPGPELLALLKFGAQNWKKDS